MDRRTGSGQIGYYNFGRNVETYGGLAPDERRVRAVAQVGTAMASGSFAAGVAGKVLVHRPRRLGVARSNDLALGERPSCNLVILGRRVQGRQGT